MKKTIKYIGIGLAIQLLPLMAMAQATDVPFQDTFTMENLIGILEAVLQWAAIIIGILAVLFILYAAFLFITSAGSDEKVGSAKKALLWGLVGIGVAILAYAAFSFIGSIINPTV